MRIPPADNGRRHYRAPIDCQWVIENQERGVVQVKVSEILVILMFEKMKKNYKLILKKYLNNKILKI
jgi:hypothetical protein